MSTERLLRLIHVMIVDDHDMLREGLATFLRAYPDLKLVGDASNGVEAVRLCQELSPDVVLMDLMMPDMDGVEAIRQIHIAQPKVRLIALTSFGEDKLVRSALQAGATSYLLKNISADRLADAIRTTCSGLPTLAPEVAQALVANHIPHPSRHEEQENALLVLTPREREVLEQMVVGHSNDEIALHLKISRYTVKNHVSNILSKLGVNSRTEAVVLAINQKNSRNLP